MTKEKATAKKAAGRIAIESTDAGNVPARSSPSLASRKRDAKGKGNVIASSSPTSASRKRKGKGKELASSSPASGSRKRKGNNALARSSPSPASRKRKGKELDRSSHDRDGRIHIDWLDAFARSSHDRSGDACDASPPSPAAKGNGKGKKRKEQAGGGGGRVRGDVKRRATTAGHPRNVRRRAAAVVAGPRTPGDMDDTDAAYEEGC